MREILFRGKSKGKWIEGSLLVKYDVDACCASDECYIVELCDFAISGYDNKRVFDIKPLEVSYKTVGQYTGLTDKNGKKIFEGDILQQYENVWVNGQTTGELRELCKFVVCYDEPYAGFTPCIWRDDDREKYNFSEDYCIVIGNIHDNPELLEADNG